MYTFLTPVNMAYIAGKVRTPCKKWELCSLLPKNCTSRHISFSLGFLIFFLISLKLNFFNFSGLVCLFQINFIWLGVLIWFILIFSQLWRERFYLDSDCFFFFFMPITIFFLMVIFRKTEKICLQILIYYCPYDLPGHFSMHIQKGGNPYFWVLTTSSLIQQLLYTKTVKKELFFCWTKCWFYIK